MDRGRDEVAMKTKQANQYFHQDLIGRNGGDRYPEVLPVVKAKNSGSVYLA